MIDRYNSKNSIVGTLYLTATHLIFVDPEANKETWVCDLLATISTPAYQICTQIEIGFCIFFAQPEELKITNEIFRLFQRSFG